MRSKFCSRWPLAFMLAASTVFLTAPQVAHSAAPGPNLAGSFSSIPAGSAVDLTSEGEADWVHWGLYTETSLDRKSGVVPQISDYKLLDSPNGFAYAYQFADNANGYTWSDGTPTPTVTNTTTGIWAYGTPQIDSGFEVTSPADTTSRTFKIYVGAFAARGRLEAFLSDASARGYTNSSLFNPGNGPSGAYTITYAAASPGQQLIVRWTLQNPAGAQGNVTLQSATLTAPNLNNAPAVALTSPPNNASLAAASDITLTATATDTDGVVLKVEFFANGNKLGEDTGNPFAFPWNNVSAGWYVLTARATDNQGAVSTSNPIEIFVNGTGGSLAGSLAVPPALPSAINLTSEGQSDWAHWGLQTNVLFNHKANVVQQISDYTKIGPNPVELYTDNYTGYNWSDGTPTLSVANATKGVFTTGMTNGFDLTAPADTTSRTLKVYLGLYAAQANFQAWLSDFSGVAYTDTTLSNYFSSSYGVYTLTYAAASPGQTLHIRYRSSRLFDQDFGNVTLQAATLVVNSSGNILPTVTISSPNNGAVLTAPASFTLAATASDSDGSVSQVEFFNGASSLGIDTTTPYSVPVNSLAAGNYTLSAVATDNLGAKATNSVSIVVNNPPTASLSSPGNGASFVAPANITLTASANDTDGSVTKVEFFEGANKLGEDTTSPYSFAWNNVSAGTYTLTVKATDDRGASTTSAAITVSVVNNATPTVTISAPSNGAVLTAPASFTFAASASDSDGAVSQVEFFNGASSLGIDTTTPYSVPFSSLAAGNYTLSAVATDNLGAKATNSVSIVVNNPPTASLSSPGNGASFVAPANITLTASANDADGSVTKVEFFEGANKLGEDTTSPYSFPWNNVSAGTYTLTVKATDDHGASTTSAAITVSVVNNATPTVTISSPNNGAVLTAPASFALAATASDSDGSVSQVEFFNGASSLGIDTTTPYSVPVSSLAAGNYTLSAVATDNLGAKATNSVSIVVNSPPTASLSSPGNGASFVAPANITITAIANDADGSVAKVEFFEGANKLGEDTTSPYSFPWNNVGAGTYTLTVKATDDRGASTTSAAITISVVNNATPTVTISSPNNGAVLTAPASFTLAATASDSDGSVSQVEFFNGAASLGIDTTTPYSVAVSSLTAGNYTLSAVATDNLGAKATNSVSIVVNNPPTASLSSPGNGASFVAPANITLTAAANDTDGSVTKVEFFEGANKLGEDTTSPYSFPWNNVGAGTYTLTVKATDDRGATTASAPVSIVVNNSVSTPVNLKNPTWSGGDFWFSFGSQTGHDYEVQYTDTLGIGVWQLLTTLSGDGSTLSVTQRNVSASQRMYRVQTK
ncbi:MAG TPA: Ig-like domain-containing protein [Verrucomicrobiae bacterium]|nr:Ig-like domain-containing protein [Verrucomicrobiae bacterium]